MSLYPKDKVSVANYRIERAFATLDEARLVANMSRWNLAANRLYYSLYYAISALLLSDGIPSHTHKGTITQVNLYYIKTGKLTTEEGKLIRQLFLMRNEADYEDFIFVTEEQIADLIPKVQSLLNKLVGMNPLAAPQPSN